eukprot:Nitzschia sp. Nitz4//scaffold331_size19140//16879//18114//NITZ4_008736-RA/size19140-processed-gene-0.35-mRNA-1//1//CDS//3329548188//6147//frame0
MGASSHSVLALLLLCGCALGQDFSDISNVPQDVTGIQVYSECDKRGEHTKAMITIEPSESDKVTVSTYPANLVKVSSRNDNLRLEWNEAVAYGATEGGIKVGFPVDQLLTLSVAAGSRAQLLNGMLSLNEIDVSSDGTLHADISSLTAEGLSVRVSSDATATIISGAPLSSLKVSSDGRADLQAPKIDEVRVSSDGHLNLNADVTYAKVDSDGKLIMEGDLAGGDVASDGQATVYGSLSGSFKVSSDGKLRASDIDSSATIRASSDGRVNVPDCSNVTTSSDGKCKVDNGISGTVSVEVSTLPFTLTGVERCGIISVWKYLMLTAVVCGACTFCICGCRYRRQRSAAQVGAPSGEDSIPEAKVVAVDYPEFDLEKEEDLKVEMPPSKEEYSTHVTPMKQEEDTATKKGESA